MRFSFLKLILSATVIAGLCGCSSSDDGDDSSETSLLVSGVATVNSKLAATSDVIVPSVGGSSLPGSFGPKSALHTVWTTAGGVNALSNSGSETLADWIGHMFDEDFVNSNDAHVTFAGRIANNLMILCFLGAAGISTDSTGLPANGTHTVTITSAMLSACDANEPDLVGASIEVTVTTPSDTTLYDKSFSIGLPGATSCPFLFKARANDDDINIATGEDQSCDGREHATRSVVRYDVSAQILRFYYISRAFAPEGNSGYEFYRGYYKEADEEVYLLGHYGGDDADHDSSSFPNYVSFTAAGKPDGTGTVAVSAKVLGQSLTDGVYNGCVNSNDGSMASSSDTLTCTLTGTSMSSAFTQVTGEFGSYSDLEDLYEIGDTVDVDFTDNTNMY